MILINIKYIYAIDPNYFEKLEKISLEISVFNKDMSKGNYHFDVHKDVETRIMNYQPLPTNRKRRSRLYHVTTSKVLKKSGVNFDNMGYVNIENGKKNQLQQILERKNLLN